MDSLCRAYGIGTGKRFIWNDAPMCGSRVFDALEAGAHDIITDYCVADVDAEWELVMRMTFNMQWGIVGRDKFEALNVELETINNSDMPLDAKRATMLHALHSAGRVPMEVNN